MALVLHTLCKTRRFWAFREEAEMKKLIVIGLILTALLEKGAAEVRFFRLLGSPGTLITSVSTNGTITWTNAQTNVSCTIQTTTSWSGGWTNCVQVTVTNRVMCVQAMTPQTVPSVPPGMVLIPGGSFTMGDAFNEYDGGGALPVHAVNVSAFYM